MKTINNFLFKQIDNSALIVFRVFFGLLIFLESVDVNVTPDKRQLFIENEKILLAVIKVIHR